MFGQNTSTNTFGQPSAFSSFGNIASSQSQPSSLFGQTTQSSLFGISQPTNSSLFATPQAQPTSTFGTQSAFGGSSLFGNTQATQQPAQQNSFFGSTNRFGGTSTSFGTTGLSTAINVPTGTTIKYQPHNSTDTIVKNGHTQSTNINIRLQCITCMREYESKSLEELRIEDYAVGRKGVQQSNLFGSSTLSSGAFNNSGMTSNFGQSSSGSLFLNTQKPFGSIAPTTTTTSLFNTGLTTSSTGGGLFGQLGTNQSAFGQQTDNKSTLSFFNPTSTAQTINSFSLTQPNSLSNANVTNSLFNNAGTTAATSGLAFGSTQTSLNQNKPIFGSGLTSTFGQTQPQTSNSLFNTQQSSGLFGSLSQPSAFSNTNTGLNKSSTFAFPQTSFGQSSSFNPSISTSNVFGANTGFGSNTSSFFGQNTLGTTNTFGSFGTNAQSQPFQSTGSSFNFNPSNSGTFGSSNTGGFNSLGLSSTAFNMNQNQVAMPANPTSLANTEQIITRLQTLPYGNLPPILLENSAQSKSKTKFTIDPKTLNQYKISAKNNDVKVQRTPVVGKPTTMLFDGLDDDSAENLKSAADIFKPRQNIKKLILNKSSNNSATINNKSIDLTPKANKTTTIIPVKDNSDNFDKENESPLKRKSLSFTDVFSMNDSAKNTSRISTNSDAKTELVINRNSFNSSITNKHHQLSESSISPDSFLVRGPLVFTNSDPETSLNNSIRLKCGVVLNRTDYYTIPSLEECDQFYNPDDDSCILENFTVGRVDYGSIYWRGPLNIKGINLDEIVHIRRKEVIVYPDDDLKPPKGEGLNRPAQITLDQVWPIDKTSRELIRDAERLRVMKYAEKLEKTTLKLDATFKEYRPDTGSWVFVVKHFSKYGLDADDEDTDAEAPPEKDDGNKDNSKNFQSTTSDRKQLHNQHSFSSGSNFKTHLNGVHSEMAFHFPETNERFEDSKKNLGSSFLFNDKSFDENQESNNFKLNNESMMMRSALFVDDNIEKVTKKCKNLSFTKSQVSSQVVSSSFFPSKIKESLPKKRLLKFSTKPSTNFVNAYSLTNYAFPKIRFINGSNRFCMIVNQEVLIFELNLIDFERENSIEKIEEHLNSHSNIETSKSDLIPPLMKTNQNSLNPKFDPILNTLIDSLYGELSETQNYARHQERLRRILAWLFNVNRSLSLPDQCYQRIIHFLSTNELEFAVTECINSKLPRLSYLVSCGPYSRKELLIAQLDTWKRCEADRFIDKELLKIYVLLSGLTFWNLSNGEIIEPLDQLEWTQQLALMLVYKTIDNNDLIGTNLVKTILEQLPVKPDDVAYHLLAQNQVWIALTSSKSYLDAWFLQENLLSYNVIINDEIEKKCDSINLFMASQTKDLGWALFFALHVKNDLLRSLYVKDLLIRNVNQLINSSDLERFLKEKYLINQKFLSEAKSYLAKQNRNYQELSLNLLELGLYKESHDVMVAKIFPELIIHENHQKISELIDLLRPHQSMISNWDICGAGIYDTFLKLLKFDPDSDLEFYRDLVKNFNIHQLKCSTDRHVLCQSQMARMVNIIFAELNKGMFAYHTPIPHDYSLIELRSNAYKLFQSRALCSKF
ncbi:nuclear pore complex protein Nup98/Nup96-like protein [Sarcoptes scabiei]|uniref:Nuclear pore complex protein Nup98-Nup96 n=1 Tax=Sarcoptes scabiei TaxID=52283 RepID=A0A132AFE5_SARSC|nr:nuclear pore complex protein Nup98/Nup96-like protein [Sarcoptes scabiei]